MNIKKGLPGSIALLALLISTGSQATTERPQLKNYSSYNDFMRAVVDYAKNDGAPSSDMRECDDPEVGPDGKPTDKLNPCLPKQPTGNEPAADATSAASGQDTAASEPDDLDSLDNLDGSSASSGQDAPADAEVTDPDIRSTPSGDTLGAGHRLPATDSIQPILTLTAPAPPFAAFRCSRLAPTTLPPSPLLTHSAACSLIPATPRFV
jgi:hypothetical protein